MSVATLTWMAGSGNNVAFAKDDKYIYGRCEIGAKLVPAEKTDKLAFGKMGLGIESLGKQVNLQFSALVYREKK